MKRSLIYISLVTLLSGCAADDKIQPVSPEACLSTFFTRARKMDNVEAFVIAKTRSFASGDSSVYYLDISDVASLSAPWKACNLPENYRKDKLAVRITGYQLTFPGMEYANTDGIPLELTHIEAR